MPQKTMFYMSLEMKYCSHFHQDAGRACGMEFNILKQTLTEHA